MGTVRESIWRVFQNSACLPPAKHSLNRPEFRVGLPNASQRIWVSSSIRAPSAVSQIRSWMAEASSMTRSRRLPLLCIPAKASGFFSDQGIMSIRQVRSRERHRERRAVAVRVEWALADQQRVKHLAKGGHVLDIRWGL